ncbi:peptide ABC transporter ATP-binding protein [Virgibacillus soli]|uniref:Nickel import system ATP-binding protein NikD n=1 Tax=Lederbergia galactosidilytica TaxID=217031 RepID=A0A178A0A0_9BACI|nr:peptide ABC transporter ATP-binding protein [Virgibacillus soli]OAK73552.1 peptide ABC transporter ATP-binding protein [Lederbergia galactosidilytica]
MGTEPSLFAVKQFSLVFRQYEKGWQESKIQAISGFNLTIQKGEIVAIVGASGSGKSLLANAILGILPENAETDGEILFEGEALTPKRQEELRGKEIALIPQSTNALDPLMKAGKQVQTMIKGKNKKKIQEGIFHKVGLASEAGERYPFELSGGMARRVLVTTAIASQAKLIIADEPTPGLDEHSRNETIQYIKQLANEGKGVMFITHDIMAALAIADRIAVFYAGQTVEIANTEDFYGKGEQLRHPYTKALWNSLPQNEFKPLPGSQPAPITVLNGCAFAPRCLKATSICKQKQPLNRSLNQGMVRCFHA